MQLFYKLAACMISATVAMGIADRVEAAFTGSNTTVSTQISVNGDLAQQLQAALDRAVRETGVPGATVSIITPNGTWTGANGFSNLKTQTAMRPQDRFNIASVSKPFTAATLLSLVDEGKLSLDDKIQKWLPAVIMANIPNGSEITIRQLLNHTSGIPDETDNPVIRNDPLGFYLRNWTQEELVALVKDVPPQNAPGQGYRYSSTNYLLAALIVESATNSNFATQVRSRILEPLGLQNTFTPPQDQTPANVVPGYYRFSQPQLQAFPPQLVQALNTNFDFVDDNQNRRLYDAKPLLFRSRGYGTGSMISTSEDVAKFAYALFGGQLLQPATLNEMLTYIRDNQGLEYGLGVYPLELPVGKVLGHDGQNPGYVSRLGYLPESSIAFAGLVNLRDESFTADAPKAVGDISAQARDKILLDTLAVLRSDSTPQPVPEPTAMAGLLALGIGGVWLKRR